jgi:hypothetical protein
MGAKVTGKARQIPKENWYKALLFVFGYYTELSEIAKVI